MHGRAPARALASVLAMPAWSNLRRLGQGLSVLSFASASTYYSATRGSTAFAQEGALKPPAATGEAARRRVWRMCAPWRCTLALHM